MAVILERWDDQSRSPNSEKAPRSVVPLHTADHGSEMTSFAQVIKVRSLWFSNHKTVCLLFNKGIHNSLWLTIDSSIAKKLSRM